jgi:hypothetical protein
MFPLLLGVLSGILSVLILAPSAFDNKPDRENQSLEAFYSLSPNKTSQSWRAGKEYLSLMNPSGIDPDSEQMTDAMVLDKFSELYELTKVHSWSFDYPSEEGEGGLVELGETIQLGWRAVQIATASCEGGGEISSRDIKKTVVAALKTSSRLLEGRPPLMQNLIGLSWGERGLDIIEICHGLANDDEVKEALGEFYELCTIEHGIRWETSILPLVVSDHEPSIDKKSSQKLRADARELRKRAEIILKGNRTSVN